MIGERIHKLEVYTCQLETLEKLLKEIIHTNDEYLSIVPDDHIEEQTHLAKDLLRQLDQIAEGAGV